MNIGRLLAVMLIITLAQGSTSAAKRTNLHVSTDQSYRGISYFTQEDRRRKPGNDPMKFGFWGSSNYEVGDSIPSDYNLPEIRNYVAKEIALATAREHEFQGKKRDSVFVDPENVQLMAEYHFPNSPDFVLLKFSHFYQSLYIGYIKSRNSFYPLGKFRVRKEDAETFIDDFNHVLKENPRVFNESPLCVVYLTVTLMAYRGSSSTPVLMLNSYDDMIGGFAILQSLSEEWVPADLLTGDDLWFSHISTDPMLHRLSKYRKDISHMFEAMESFGFKDSLTYSPPQIEKYGDSSVVTLTACSGMMRGLSRFRVSISPDNSILNFSRVRGPFRGPATALYELLGCDPFPNPLSYSADTPWWTECLEHLKKKMKDGKLFRKGMGRK